MRSTIFIMLCLMLTYFNVHAQDTITVYYDTNWVVKQNHAEACYYRKAFRDTNSYWTVIDYYMNNNIQMTGTYTTSDFKIKNGLFVYYYINGQKQSEGEIVNNKKVGYWTEWHDNGKLLAVGKFVNNKPDSIWNYYDNEGKLRQVDSYTSGKQTYKTFYFSNGTVWCKGPCVNSLPDGEWMYWNADGRLYMRGYYSRGRVYGEWFRYFTNGETMRLLYRDGAIINRSPGGILKQSGSK